MKNTIKKLLPVILAILVICIIIIVALSRCSKEGDSISDGSKNANAGRKAEAGKQVSQSGLKADQLDESDWAVLEFSNEFSEVKGNPMGADIEFLLWDVATAPDDKESTGDQMGAAAAQPSGTSLADLAEKYSQLLSSEGVHYVDKNNAFGMDLEMEYWIKEGKFKEYDKTLNRITLYDGKYYYIAELDEKTAKRFDKNDMGVTSDVDIKTKGVLSRMAYAGYTQEADQKVGEFDCCVYYLDMEVMGMKGSRLFVDKNTGMLVKNITGDEENGMTTIITEFQAGGFGDEVFKLPADITVN